MFFESQNTDFEEKVADPSQQAKPAKAAKPAKNKNPEKFDDGVGVEEQPLSILLGEGIPKLTIGKPKTVPQ